MLSPDGTESASRAGGNGAAAPRRGRTSTAPDRYWRELVGAGRTNISGPAAARVRETPDLTEDELAQAADDILIQRRNWAPS